MGMCEHPQDTCDKTSNDPGRDESSRRHWNDKTVFLQQSRYIEEGGEEEGHGRERLKVVRQCRRRHRIRAKLSGAGRERKLRIRKVQGLPELKEARTQEHPGTPGSH